MHFVCSGGATHPPTARSGGTRPRVGCGLPERPRSGRQLQLAGRAAYLLHEAMNPKWHRPIATQQNDRVAIVGNFYAYRRAIALRLYADGIALDLRGPRPPRWAHPEIVRLHSGSYVVGNAKSAVFGQSLGCLNAFAFGRRQLLELSRFANRWGRWPAVARGSADRGRMLRARERGPGVQGISRAS